MNTMRRTTRAGALIARQRHWASCVILPRRCAATIARGDTDASSSAAAEAARRARAEQIRRQERTLRWLRALIIPLFTFYGLFILRPTEGHFLRYLAERRHLEPEFNMLFPPLRLPGSEAATEGPGSTTVAGAADPKTKADHSIGFRSPKDREFYAQKFAIAPNSEDERRLAQRRLLFARERSYSVVEDGSVETVKSAAERLEELAASRQHPPMHILGAQLNEIAERSRRHSDENLPIRIVFRDHTFFATAQLIFSDPDGHTVQTLKFVGVCGMLWRCLS